MTSFLHYLGNHNKISHIYPVTSLHKNVTRIDEVEKKIEEVRKFFCSFERPPAFRPAIGDGSIERTLDLVLA